MPQINYSQRLVLCFQESWLLNKYLIPILPIGIIFIFLGVNLWPGAFINTVLFDPILANKSDYIAEQMQNGKSMKFLFMSLALIVILLIVSEHNYLVRLKNKQNFVLKPFTNSQRIITLYFNTFAFVTIGLCCIYFLDQFLVQTMRTLYAEKTKELLTDNGFLYVDYAENSFFTAYPRKYIVAFSTVVLLLTPLSHILYFPFKKYSPLWSSLCIAAFLGTLLCILYK